MNVSEAVQSRRSVRAFLDRPVSKDVLIRVLDKARFAPSGGNVQPWNAVVLGGERLKALCRQVSEAMATGKVEPEYQIYPSGLPDPYRARRFSIGEHMYASIGIGREDKEARLRQLARNFQAFDAPAALFCYTPAYMGKPQWSDLGMWLQTIMLLLREEGLESCPQEAWSAQGRIIKAFLDIPADDFTFFCAIAIGHADPDAPINRFPRERAPLEEMVRFEGF